uniref:Uncharacterized protein n=1 Tax=Lepeophtheirus salmonis TaxID=72036 RepID=A0A0K2V997_LEPSM
MTYLSVSNWMLATTWGPNFSSWDSFKRATLGFVTRMKSDGSVSLVNLSPSSSAERTDSSIKSSNSGYCCRSLNC